MDSNHNKISKFVLILLNLLDRKQYQNILRWTQDGAGVQIINRKHLQTKILPNYFNQHKVTSFTRQLHLYGFYKTKDPSKNDVFEHAFFLKQIRSNYHLIKRKYKERLPVLEKESLPTITNQERQSPEMIPSQLSQLKSYAQLKSFSDKNIPKQVVFEDWYHSKEEQLSLIVDDFFN